MRLYHTCGNVLTVVRSISLTLLSNFDLNDDKIVLTKHRLVDSKNLSPFLSLEKCNIFHCNRCHEDVPYAAARIACDDCGTLYLLTDLKNIGGLVFCKRCLNKNKNFDDFNIFGEKSKTKKQRDRILDEERENLERSVRQAGNSITMPANVGGDRPDNILSILWGSEPRTLDTDVNFTSPVVIPQVPSPSAADFEWRIAEENPERIRRSNPFSSTTISTNSRR